MACFGKELDKGSDLPAINDFQETNQLISQVSADEIAAIQKGRLIFPNLFETLAVVQKTLALAHGRVIIHVNDAADQVVIQRLYDGHDPVLLRSPYILSGSLGHVIPPLGKVCGANGSNAFPRDGVIIFRRAVRYLLYESEDINAGFLRGPLFQFGNPTLRVDQFCFREVLISAAGHPDPESRNDDGLAMDLQNRNGYAPTVDADFPDAGVLGVGLN